jgi:hypothetical protein
VEHPCDDVEPPESAHGGVGATFFYRGGHNFIVLEWSALSHGHARISPQIYFGRNEKSVVFASSSCAVELSDSATGTWSLIVRQADADHEWRRYEMRRTLLRVWSAWSVVDWASRGGCVGYESHCCY